jgi:hypothetical protein
VLILVVLSTPLLAQSPASEQPRSRSDSTDGASKPAVAGNEKSVASAQNAQSPQQLSEVQRLRSEVEQLRSELERLRSLVETKSGGSGATPQLSPTEIDRTATSQSTSPVPDKRGVAIATKAQGGDLSGAGNLLRTDRITIGGYGDFQFRESSISERADGGGTPTFQSTRFVLEVAVVLSEKQNIVFNSEIEYEFGSREIDVEQAYIEWKMRPEFAFRGGIIVPAIGRFNTYHDSYLNLTTIRPLVNQFIIPSAYRDAGIGIRGRFKLPNKMKFSYEADLVNGMQSVNTDGEATPFSRLLGQSSAAEPGQSRFRLRTDARQWSDVLGSRQLQDSNLASRATTENLVSVASRFNQQRFSLSTVRIIVGR